MAAGEGARFTLGLPWQLMQRRWNKPKPISVPAGGGDVDWPRTGLYDVAKAITSGVVRGTSARRRVSISTHQVMISHWPFSDLSSR